MGLRAGCAMGVSGAPGRLGRLGSLMAERGVSSCRGVWSSKEFLQVKKTLSNKLHADMNSQNLPGA